MKAVTSLFLLLLVFGTPSAWAGAEEEVAKVEEQWVKAFNEGNLQALGALYAENAIFISVVAPVRQEGREVIRKHFAGTFERLAKRELVHRDMSVRIYGNTAVVNMYEDITATDREGKVRKLTNRKTGVWVKLGEKWEIVTHHSSQAVRPAAQQAS